MDKNMPQNIQEKQEKKKCVVRETTEIGFGNVRGCYTAKVIKWTWHNMKIDK